MTGNFHRYFSGDSTFIFCQFPQAEENVFRRLNILFHLGGFFFALNLLVQEKRPPSLPSPLHKSPLSERVGKRGDGGEGGNSRRRGRGRFVRLSSSGGRRRRRWGEGKRRRGTLAYTQKVPLSSLSTDEWASAKEWEGKENKKIP